MKKALLIISVFATTSLIDLAFAQSISIAPAYPVGATVQHHGTSATVSAYDPTRPLKQAVVAVREEYGWDVDFEEPAYQKTPSGGQFNSTYPEGTDVFASTASEGSILGKIVSDYNQGGFTGKFATIQLSDGSYAVIGASVKDSGGADQAVIPILNTQISLARDSRSMAETLELITATISSVSGVNVSLNDPINVVLQAPNVTVGGSNIPARDLLVQAMKSSPVKMNWSLLFDPMHKVYVLNLAPVVRAYYDAFGRKGTMAVQ